jgi:hypothetical protein
MRQPLPSRAGGSVEFRGWRWLCPKCGRRVQVVFWPLTRTNVAVPYPSWREELRGAGAEPQPTWPTASLGFACARCHRVRYFTRASRDFWNDLVACLSCCLLYGREVERPAWATKKRNRSVIVPPGGYTPGGDWMEVSPEVSIRRPRLGCRLSTK